MICPNVTPLAHMVARHQQAKHGVFLLVWCILYSFHVFTFQSNSSRSSSLALLLRLHLSKMCRLLPWREEMGRSIDVAVNLEETWHHYCEATANKETQWGQSAEQHQEIRCIFGFYFFIQNLTGPNIDNIQFTVRERNRRIPHNCAHMFFFSFFLSLCPMYWQQQCVWVSLWRLKDFILKRRHCDPRMWITQFNLLSWFYYISSDLQAISWLREGRKWKTRNR